MTIFGEDIPDETIELGTFSVETPTVVSPPFLLPVV